MAFENSQALAIESKKKVDTHQFENTCRLDVNGKPVKKVVSVNAMPKIMQSEKSEGIAFSGKTTYEIVYESEENELCSLVADVDWNGSIVSPFDNYFLCPKIEENTITGFSTTEIAISSLVSIDIYAVVSDKISTVNNLSDDYVSVQKNYEYQKFVNMASQTFNEVAEQEFNAKVDQILHYEGDLRIKNATCGIDSVTVEGDCFVDVYVSCEGNVSRITKSVEFREEMPALSVVPSNIISADGYLSGLKVTASVSEIDNKTNIIMALEINVNACVFANENCTLIEDAFSVTNQILTSRECVEKVNFVAQEFLTENVSGSFESAREIEELCYVHAVETVITDISSDSISGGIKLYAVGVAENKDSVKVEGLVPFTIAGLENSDNDEFAASAQIVSYKLRGHKEVEITLSVGVKHKKTASEYVSYISQIEEGEQKCAQTSAIRVYITKKGEDLFSVAKALSIRPEEILKQNADAENLTEGTRLVVYSPLDINF